MIKIDKIYTSKKVENIKVIDFDKNNKKRPSWIKVNLDKKVIFIKIFFEEEAFWYRRYFNDYFFPLESNSEDYKNYYNKIAKDYESFVPQNKELAKIIISFLSEFNINLNAEILDLGAGTGMVSELVAKTGYKKITLVDISDKELNIAKGKKLLQNAIFKKIDLTIEDIEGKYDVIFETMALDYFKEKELKEILEKIKKSLNKSGMFFAIDRHITPEFEESFQKIRKEKIAIKTPEGFFDYYYFIGKK